MFNISSFPFKPCVGYLKICWSKEFGLQKLHLREENNSNQIKTSPQPVLKGEDESPGATEKMFNKFLTVGVWKQLRFINQSYSFSIKENQNQNTFQS